MGLDVSTLERVQGLVVDKLMDDSVDIGGLRKKHVLIRDPRKPGSVVFMPPDFKDVPKLIKQLMTFVNASFGNIDPIILAGLFHRQCVIIHPFMDGNGRSTRLMTTAILGHGGIDLFNCGIICQTENPKRVPKSLPANEFNCVEKCPRVTFLKTCDIQRNSNE